MIIVVACLLHNFIIDIKGEDMDFEFSDESSDESDSEDDENWNENGGNENNEAIAKRDRICASL